MKSLKHWSELTAINIITALAGAFLVGSPWLFGFAGEQTAMWSAGLIGVLAIMVALAGFIELREWEGWASLALGLWAAVTPWALGFSGVTAAMGIHLGVGLTIAALAALELWMIHNKPGKLA
ncbi:SPW repeat protein [Microvirga arsenatis]|uniref:SPW repeat-containing integral membrane domain-containing protein n=1 Tax=Microvirga arsenatis TaxID=2692265 RepID=A0ABW9Z3L4_9HYPH|nr:SPW repeat protein [Microvirga arsenatis]NBJ13674.1 hypothetical protein [Microvirga arsenatis]NBJ27127.1 hypothetical protein [Microvirga arsenatis]